MKKITKIQQKYDVTKKGVAEEEVPQKAKPVLLCSSMKKMVQDPGFKKSQTSKNLDIKISQKLINEIS